MPIVLFKIALSATVVSFCSWLACRRPEISGLLVALPLNAMMVLAFSYSESGDAEMGVKFAQSFLSAIPILVLFFVPFLLSKKFHFGFWQSYAIGIGLVFFGCLIHRGFLRVFT